LTITLGLEDDQREVAIINYIKVNPGTTINQVVKYMDKNGSSKMTTLKKIDHLISGKRIRDEPAKQNGFHRLFYNDRNEFDKILRQLSEIEALVNKVDVLIHGLKIQKPEDNDFTDFDMSVILTYDDTTELRLRILSVQIKEKIYSEEDRQIIYSKIIALLLKLDNQAFYRRLADRYEVDFLNYQLNSLKETLSIEEYAKLRPKFVNVGNQLIQEVENFKIEFL